MYVSFVPGSTYRMTNVVNKCWYFFNRFVNFVSYIVAVRENSKFQLLRAAVSKIHSQTSHQKNRDYVLTTMQISTSESVVNVINVYFIYDLLSLFS